MAAVSMGLLPPSSGNLIAHSSAAALRNPSPHAEAMLSWVLLASN